MRGRTRGLQNIFQLCDVFLTRQTKELDLNPNECELVVTLNKERFKVKTRWSEDGFMVDIVGRKEVVLNTDWLVGEPMMLADMNGKEVTVQVSGNRSLSNQQVDVMYTFFFFFVY